jgi:hypothetical protein
LLGRTSTVPLTSLKFKEPVTIASGVTLSTSGAGTVSFGGGIDGGSGALHVRGGNADSGGNLILAALTVSPSAKLTVNAGGGSNGVLNAAALANTGTIDLRDNKLVTNTAVGTFAGGAYDGVHGDVQRAYHSGAWDRPGLMTSMPEAGPTIGTTTIGVASAAQILFLAPTATGTWAGQPITGASTLAMYTYAGDLNFDGRVDAQDYGVIDNWVQFPGTSGYANGDINYDGVIDAADYGIIDNTIQLQGAPIPSGATVLGGVSAVPEPVSVATLGVAAAMAMLRRRRRRARRT